METDQDRDEQGRFRQGCRPGPGRPQGRRVKPPSVADLVALARQPSLQEEADKDLAMRAELAEAGHSGEELERRVRTRKRLWAKIRAAATEQLLEELTIRPSRARKSSGEERA